MAWPGSAQQAPRQSGDAGKETPWFTVVGVVGSVAGRLPTQMMIYLPPMLGDEATARTRFWCAVRMPRMQAKRSGRPSSGSIPIFPWRQCGRCRRSWTDRSMALSASASTAVRSSWALLG